MEGSAIRVVVADDHPLFRGALRQALASLLPGAHVIEANGLDDLTATLAREGDIDLVLLDLTMPGVQGFSGLIYLRAQHPDVPVVIVSANEDPVVIRRAIEFGAAGFIPKSLESDRIGKAIQAVLAGDAWIPPDIELNASEDKETAEMMRRLATLTPQQVRVLDDAVRGAPQQADRLRARRLGGDRQGACLGDPAEARGREPDPGGDRLLEDRRDAAPCRHRSRVALSRLSAARSPE